MKFVGWVAFAIGLVEFCATGCAGSDGIDVPRSMAPSPAEGGSEIQSGPSLAGSSAGGAKSKGESSAGAPAAGDQALECGGQSGTDGDDENIGVGGTGGDDESAGGERATTPVSGVVCEPLTHSGCLDAYVGHWTCGGEDVDSNSTLATALPASPGGHITFDITADGRAQGHQTAYATADTVQCLRCDGTGTHTDYAYDLGSYVYGDVLASDVNGGKLREFVTWCIGSESDCAGAPQGWSRWDCVR